MRRWFLSFALLLGGCAVEAEPGWQAKLEHQVSRDALRGDPAAVVALPVDEDPAPGDRVVFAITLEQGERAKTWQVAVTVEGVALDRVLDFREIAAFEERVQPGEARRRKIEAAQAEFRASSVDLLDLRREGAIARLVVEAFDEQGASLARAESEALVSRLRLGLLPACRAGHRQRDPMRGRVEAGLQAPLLTLDDAAFDDVRDAALGVDSCKVLFQILRSNPVTRQILREVLALPSLWSILTNWGVRVSFTVDFFAAERVDPARFPGEPRELWSVPMVVLLNGQPGFLARVIVGPSGSPDGAVAGIYGIVARHPSDEHRRVFVRLASSTRGAREPAPAAPQTSAAPTSR